MSQTLKAILEIKAITGKYGKLTAKLDNTFLALFKEL